jgi:hypothetical protein
MLNELWHNGKLTHEQVIFITAHLKNKEDEQYAKTKGF